MVYLSRSRARGYFAVAVVVVVAILSGEVKKGKVLKPSPGMRRYNIPRQTPTSNASARWQ